MCLDDSLSDSQKFKYQFQCGRCVGALRHLVGENLNQFSARARLNGRRLAVGWLVCPLGGTGLTRYVALLFDPDNLEGVIPDVTRENALSIFPENPVHLTKVRALRTER